MTRVDDIETARIVANEREAVGVMRHRDSGREQMGIRPWHELEYAAVVEDSDRILADALTPAAWMWLARLAADALEPAVPAPPIMLPRCSYRVPVMRRRATQRSPP